MSQSPFDTDEKLAAMKQDIVDRSFNIKITGMLISGALAIAGVALMAALPAAATLASTLLPLAMLGGSALTGLITYKATERLKIDREFLESKMQGSNWGHGNWEAYRKEVAEHGYAGPVAPFAPSGPPSHAQHRE